MLRRNGVRRKVTQRHLRDHCSYTGMRNRDLDVGASKGDAEDGFCSGIWMLEVRGSEESRLTQVISMND